MCGIVSIWLKNKPISPSDLEASLVALEHRGPDGKNFWIAPEKNVGLGHTRLSIIGINNGNQPLFNSENEIYAVVNGEFYDYKDLRAHYQKKGYKFSTETDSEIIIPLYLEYGSKMFEQLNGEFSFIIWDKRKQRMFAARDRFGIKPLFYTVFKENFYVASEIKALLPLGVKLEWNQQSVDGILRGVPSQEFSCFKNIKQIKPGHYLIITKSRLIEEKYWDFEYKDKSIKITDQEYIDLFRMKLITAIKRRLVADVPVGFYLSGGIDSSAVLALSSQINKNLTAFNISFKNSEHDENNFARELSLHTGTKLLSIDVNTKDLADNFSNVVFHRESAVFQTNGIAKYLLSNFARKSGFKVIMTGEGADEILAGYPPFIEDCINHVEHDERILLNEEMKKKDQSFIYEGDFNTLEINRIKTLLGYFPSLWKLSFDIGNVVQGIYSDHFKEFSLKQYPMENFIKNSSLFNQNNVHPVNQSLYIFCKTFFPELVLSYLGDRVEMAHSIEGRLPFLDVDLVTFSNNLPINLKIRGLREKYILYEAVKDFIPKNIYLRQKKPITAPSMIDNNLNKKSPLEILMQDIFHSQDFKELTFFDQSKTINLLKIIKTLDASNRIVPEYVLNYVLSLYFLHKRFI